MAEPIEVTGTYRDQANKDSTNTVYIADGLSLAQITEGLQAFASLVDDVVTTILRGLSFTVSIDISALTGNISSADSDVEEVAEYISTTAAGREVVLNLPATNDTQSALGSDDLDQTDVNVADLISMLEDGLATTGGTIIPCDVDENDIVSVVTARERVRNTGTRGA